MQSLARNGYTEQEVRDMLHGKHGSRVIGFRYDLLNSNENKKGELRRVTSGEVSMSSLSTIKRTAKFSLEDELIDTRSYYTWSDVGGKEWDDLGGDSWGELWSLKRDNAQKVDWLNDRIQPFVIFMMPDGGTIEFPLGIFLPSSPKRVDSNGMVQREVEAYDATIILDQDKFTERYYIAKGVRYDEAIKDILKSAGITKINITIENTPFLKTDKEYAIGTSKLEAVNDLLSAMNNTPIWVDAGGYFRSSPYVRPDKRPSGYTYDDSELSIVAEGVEDEQDLFDVANSWVVTVSNPEVTPLVARKENTNPDNPTSIPSRNGRTIVDFREVNDISSQEALNGYVDRIASEASQVFGKVKFTTPIMPIHEYNDIITFRYSPLGLDDKYSETKWTIPLGAGGEMTHEVRKVVSID